MKSIFTYKWPKLFQSQNDEEAVEYYELLKKKLAEAAPGNCSGFQEEDKIESGKSYYKKHDYKRDIVLKYEYCWDGYTELEVTFITDNDGFSKIEFSVINNYYRKDYDAKKKEGK